MNKGRLEAFSDGVIAVAITLLVLNIVVPDPGFEHLAGVRHPHTLAYELAQKWPSYAAYVVSFMTIGIIWINHHAMIGRLREADHTILILNLVLLMGIVVIPFSTNLLATYLHQGTAGDAEFAAAVYAAALLVMSLAFSILNRQILISRAHLMHERLPLADRQAIFRRAVTGVAPYAVAVALAPLSAYATLALTGAIAVFYALPIASSAPLSHPHG